MGAFDTVDNKVQELTGEAKQRYGEFTDDEKMQTEGTVDEFSGNIKQAGEKVTDSIR
jgi:uncharacterized protein YjbJ (UPF0337 family)